MLFSKTIYERDIFLAAMHQVMPNVLRLIIMLTQIPFIVNGTIIGLNLVIFPSENICNFTDNQINCKISRIYWEESKVMM